MLEAKKCRELSNIFIQSNTIYIHASKAFYFQDQNEVAFIYGSFASGRAGADSVDVFLIGDVDENELIKTVREVEKNACFKLAENEGYKVKVHDPLVKRFKVKVLGDGRLSTYRAFYIKVIASVIHERYANPREISGCSG